MKLTQVITTYFPPEDTEGMRIGAAREARRLLWSNLRCYGTDITDIIVDDGSPLESLLSFAGSRPTYRQDRRGVGASLNKGFRYAFEIDSCVLYCVDDWALNQEFDITPWLRLLHDREDIGMVRLGPPHPNTSGTVEMLTEDWQGWGLRLDRKGFAFGHRPALYHKRMIDYYGWFEEGVSALECERLYNEKFCADPKGPDIVLALPHPWWHIDTPSLSAMEPKGCY